MVVAVPGQGSQYAGVCQDSSGAWLLGERTYRINLPKDVPAGMFWSLTTYESETRSMIRNARIEDPTAEVLDFQAPSFLTTSRQSRRHRSRW